jgi:hypothetical protein
MAKSPLPASFAPNPSSGVESSATAFGLRAGGRASRAGAVAVCCALPSRSPARVTLLDIAGRVRDAQDLSTMDTGEHRVELGQNLESGVFFVRLDRGTQHSTLKIVLR